MKSATEHTPQPSRWKRIFYFFPFQLVFMHLKHNHFFLLLWGILFGYATGLVGTKYGVPYLFYTPEYMHKVNFWAFAIVGFAFAGFVMAFNIYTYVLHGYKFPFIAGLARPFYKFCLNNSLIPLAFMAIFMINSSKMQHYQELIPWDQVIVNMLGLTSGIIVFLTLSFLYFFRTNKDVERIMRRRRKHSENKARKSPNFFQFRRTGKHIRFDRRWTVISYVSAPFRVKVARPAGHYEDELLRKVFAQNHVNASIYEIVLFISFILIGSFRDDPFFQIPAGASVFLMLTILVLLYSIFYSWLGKWTTTVIFMLILTLNFLSGRFDELRFKNHAYGLDYTQTHAPYNEKHLRSLADSTNVAEDKRRSLYMLNNWLAQNQVIQDKPKMIILNTSGGGLRSTLWTFTVLQHLDSLTQGTLFDQTHFISGSSGGMMGAAYFRELYRRREKGVDINISSPEYRQRLSNDLLNPIALSIATTDVFLRYQTIEDGDYTYSKDRAYAFEQGFNDNTLNYLEDLRLSDYTYDEFNGTIPMMVFTPTIINDGRRLVIASQPVSYLSDYRPGTHFVADHSIENVEFTKLFTEQDAWNLKFTSAIRMSATFPYVLPMVSMPSDPRIEIMDAGLRDNYGLKITLQYLYTFREWIEEHTSGVVIIQIRDNEKFTETEEGVGSLFYRVFRPLGSLYGNFTRTQDYDSDQLLLYFSNCFNTEISVIPLILDRTKRNISLSWHLTALEKEQIEASIQSPLNERSFNKLKEELGIE